MGDCRKCIHKYETKILLNTINDWKELAKDPQYKGTQILEFHWGKHKLYLEEIKEHDCNAGRWNYVTLRDRISWDKSNWRVTVPKLRKILRSYDSFYSGLHAEISVHWDDSKMEHFFAGVTKIIREGNKLIIKLKKL